MCQLSLYVLIPEHSWKHLITKDLKSFDVAKQKVQQQMQQMLLMQNIYQRAA